MQTALAEQIDGKVYREAEPDELKDCAARMVDMYNSERQDEVLRLAASEMSVSSDQVHPHRTGCIYRESSSWDIIIGSSKLSSSPTLT